MINYLVVALVGFSLGRLGHIIGGQIAWIPHHWLIGLVIMALAVFLWKKSSSKTRALILFLGLGIFFSDFKDFLDFKFFAPEDVNLVRFWGID